MTLKTLGMGIVRKILKKKVIDRSTGKPFAKSIQDHMRAGDKRRTAMKKAGYKQEPHRRASSRIDKKGDEIIRVKEIWSYNPYKKAKKGINYKKIAKKTAPIAAAGAAGVAYGERKGKK